MVGLRFLVAKLQLRYVILAFASCIISQARQCYTVMSQIMGIVSANVN